AVDREGRRPAGLSRSEGERRVRRDQSLSPALRSGQARPDRFTGGALAQRKNAAARGSYLEPNPQGDGGAMKWGGLWVGFLFFALDAAPPPAPFEALTPL